MRYIVLLAGLAFYSCTAYRMIETGLYFGQLKPGGGQVTAAEWNSFKENEMAKVFTAGNTVFNATGNWYDPVSKELITEPTYVVVYIYKRSAQVSNEIDSLRDLYKTRFQQQSVLRVDKKVKVKF